MENRKAEINVENLYSLFFKDYPDVLNIKQLCEILGGISRKTAYTLLQEKKIKSFRIGHSYRIPKIFVLEYLGIINLSL